MHANNCSHFGSFENEALIGRYSSRGQVFDKHARKVTKRRVIQESRVKSQEDKNKKIKKRRQDFKTKRRL